MPINTQNVSLRISAGLPKQFPTDKMVQVALSGRSNVGKSSLVNTLLGRKSLARVSSSPGKTITVNFYDVDKKGNKIRCKSIAVTALFYERVLTQTEADTLFQRYFMSETEFRSPYPYPSVSQSDPTFKDPGSFNSWGYFSQALTALRTLRWMPHYGYTEEWHRLLRIWHSAWEASPHPFGQELHPITGEPSPSSPYYSSCMLLYLLAEKIL